MNYEEVSIVFESCRFRVSLCSRHDKRIILGHLNAFSQECFDHNFYCCHHYLSPQGTKSNNLYPETSTLITPPKDPNALIAANSIPSPIPSGGNSLKPSHHKPEEPFTPVQSAAEYDKNDFQLLNDFEPLPYTCNIFDESCSPNNAINNNLWQRVYSPLQATPNSDYTQAKNEDGDQKQFQGKYTSPIGLTEGLITPGNTVFKKDEPENNEIKPQLPDVNAADYAERPPSYPQNHWPVYHPPPYYWYHPYHYGYQHPHPYGAQDNQPNNPRVSRPTLYPK
eukprot:CAMPEP_0172321918 /NCGR_PEP_ID=MMETSP1058-20130122/44652_1 /TAXON_ID=83371 /ORGANISM="Detonula confervacea, Strain CCMP 353" /LENGTH=279 /DNA_ID=CAMNT_0013037539 /DNA_START=127 /DNA_END=963 /DNA_ORIENTATION=-